MWLLHRLRGLVSPIVVEVLNEGKAIPHPEVSSSSSNSSVLVAVALEKACLGLQGEFLSADGHSVDYVRLRESSSFTEFVAKAVALQTVDLSALSPVERKAFFISTRL